MQKLKQIIKILLISCLSISCNFSKIRDLEQKNLRLVLDYDSSGRRYINEDESGCHVRFYRHSKEYLGSVGQESEQDVTYCDDVVGYDSLDYIDLADFFEKVRKKVTGEKE